MREASVSNRTWLPAVSVEDSKPRGLCFYRKYQTFKPITWAQTYTRFHFLTVSLRYATHAPNRLHECTSLVCVSLCVHPFVNICHLGVVLMGLSAGADLPLHLLSQDGLILSALPLLVYALYLSPALC